MQIMPETADRYGVADPFDPEANIRGGARYLRFLHDLFPNRLPLVLAAYNAGESVVLRHNGIPPYREMRQYVDRVLDHYARRGLGQSAPATLPVPPPVAAAQALFSLPGPVVLRIEYADGALLYTNVPSASSSRPR
jgi:hypothetical protein